MSDTHFSEQEISVGCFCEDKFAILGQDIRDYRWETDDGTMQPVCEDWFDNLQRRYNL